MVYRREYYSEYFNNRILFNYKKSGNPATYDSLDKNGGHYAEWNKLDVETQTNTKNIFIYMWTLKKIHRSRE